MRFVSVISATAFAMSAGLPLAASAQSGADVQYASYVLMCEARYEAKGTPEVAAFWTEQRGDLTPKEIDAAQKNIGSISGVLTQIGDETIVKRCEVLKSAIDDPDGFVDERSPELIAIADRMPVYIKRVAAELKASGIQAEYLIHITEVTVSLANTIESDLERSKLVERYLLSAIHGLSEQRQAIASVRESKKKSKALFSVASWCPKSITKDFPELVKTHADAGEYDRALSTAVQSVLLDGLENYLKREGPSGESVSGVQALVERQAALKQKESLTTQEAAQMNTYRSLIVSSCLSGKLGPTLERTVYDPAEKAEALTIKEIAGLE